jgi:hypothetical protein
MYQGPSFSTAPLEKKDIPLACLLMGLFIGLPILAGVLGYYHLLG